MFVKTAAQGKEELDPAAYRTLKQRDACMAETSPLILYGRLRNGQLQKKKPHPNSRLTPLERKADGSH